MAREHPRWRAAVNVVVAAGLPIGLGVLLASPQGRAWSVSLGDATDTFDRGLRWLLRGGLRWIATPVIVMSVLACFVHMIRGGRLRAAVTAFVVGLGSFMTSEAIKLDFLPFPDYGVDGDRDVSGHVAMVSAALVILVLAARGMGTWTFRALAWITLVGVGMGVIGASWHDAGDGLVALAVTTAWLVAALAASGRAGRHSWPPSNRSLATVGSAVVLVLAAGAAAIVVTDAGHSIHASVLAAVLAITSGATLVTLIAVALSDTLAVAEAAGAGCWTTSPRRAVDPATPTGPRT